MDEIKAIEKEVKQDYFNPFFEVTKQIIMPMWEKVQNTFNWGEAFDLAWHWGRMIEREYEIRQILEECKELLA